MKITVLAALAMVLAMVVPALADGKSPLAHTMKSIDGKDVNLADYKGKVVLIVNVASRCGNTPQYDGLQKLYDKYKGQGLTVLGFPANEFGAQEPGSDKEIAQFCTSKYSVTFPMFSKIVVKGDGISPLYQDLTAAKTDPQPSGPVTWNFEKFLIGRDGKVAARFAPKAKPESGEVVTAIETELAKK